VVHSIDDEQMQCPDLDSFAKYWSCYCDQGDFFGRIGLERWNEVE